MEFLLDLFYSIKDGDFYSDDFKNEKAFKYVRKEKNTT